MGSTDGSRRQMEVVDTGAPISVPVGKEVLGRMFNLLGEPIDGMPAVKTEKRFPIHRPTPEFSETNQPKRKFWKPESKSLISFVRF